MVTSLINFAWIYINTCKTKNISVDQILLNICFKDSIVLTIKPNKDTIRAVHFYSTSLINTNVKILNKISETEINSNYKDHALLLSCSYSCSAKMLWHAWVINQMKDINNVMQNKHLKKFSSILWFI